MDVGEGGREGGTYTESGVVGSPCRVFCSSLGADVMMAMAPIGAVMSITNTAIVSTCKLGVR